VNRASRRQASLKYAFVPETHAQFPESKIQAHRDSGILPLIATGAQSHAQNKFVGVIKGKYGDDHQRCIKIQISEPEMLAQQVRKTA